ncbi:hypothetical protein SLS61_004850 [Didymella pomorum]
MASDGVLMATAIQGLVINSRPSYESMRWHGTLMAMAVVVICLMFNSFWSKGLPKVETATFCLHVVLFVIVLVIITVMSPEKSSKSPSLDAVLERWWL